MKLWNSDIRYNKFNVNEKIKNTYKELFLFVCCQLWLGKVYGDYNKK